MWLVLRKKKKAGVRISGCGDEVRNRVEGSWSFKYSGQDGLTEGVTFEQLEIESEVCGSPGNSAGGRRRRSSWSACGERSFRASIRRALVFTLSRSIRFGIEE